jgi:hypothetical protein
MSQVASPYGLRIAKYMGDTPFSAGMHSYPMTANSAAGMFFGDPVGLQNGQPVALAASPTPTLSANSPIGVFMGCEYQDPVRGFVNSQYLPANALNNGATKIKVKIFDNPNVVMIVQADGSVPLNKIGFNGSLNIAAGSVTTGNSIISLNSASLTPGTAAAAVRIYDFLYTPEPSPGAGSQPGDAFTDVLVVWCFGTHRFQNAGGQ